MNVVQDKRTIYSTIGYQLFLMHQVKKPLMEGVQTLTSPDVNFAGKMKAVRKIWRAYQNFLKMPEPTVENTHHPNTHNIIHLRDWFCARCKLAALRVNFVRTCFNFWAVINEMDPPWRMMSDKVREEGFRLDWVPTGYDGEPCEYDWWLKDK